MNIGRYYFFAQGAIHRTSLTRHQPAIGADGAIYAAASIKELSRPLRL